MKYLFGLGTSVLVVAILGIFIGIDTAKASPPPVITVTTTGATQIERTTAVLNGTVSTDSGTPTITESGFEYGLNTDYGSTILANGTPALGDFSSSATDLTCGTTYHMRAYSKYAIIAYLKPHSILALFANVAYATPPDSTTYGSDTTFTTEACSESTHRGTTVKAQISNLIKNGNTELAGELSKEFSIPLPSDMPPPVSSIPTTVFERNLHLGSSGEEVQLLQRYLNGKGFTVAKEGVGSTGNETTYFGPATKAALMAFQKASGITPASGYFGPITRAYIQSH